MRSLILAIAASLMLAACTTYDPYPTQPQQASPPPPPPPGPGMT